MAEFLENIPTGQPRLPENYWGVNRDDVQSPVITKNLEQSLEEISIFNKQKL